MLLSAQSSSVSGNTANIESQSSYSSLVVGISWVVLLALLVLLGSFNNNGSYVVSQAAKLPIGLLLLLATSALIVYLALARRVTSIFRELLVMSAIACGVYVASQLVQGTMGGIIISVGQLVMLLGFYLHCSTLRWTNIMLLSLSFIFGGYCALIAVSWFVLGVPARYTHYMTNANLSGSYTAFCLFFICMGLIINQTLFNKLTLSVVGLVSLLLVYNSGSRAALLALICAFLTYAFWNKIVLSKGRYITFFTIVITLITAIVILYIYILILPFGDILDKISQELVGKTIYSPRLMIWMVILQKLSLKPILGYGPYYIPQHLIDTGYSAHNVYLQVALQSGFLGLIALIALLGSVWASFWPGRWDPRVRLAGAFLIAIIVHQTFDVSLTQHNPAQALLMWLILGIGTGISLHSAREALPVAPLSGGMHPRNPGWRTPRGSKNRFLAGPACTSGSAGMRN